MLNIFKKSLAIILLPIVLIVFWVDYGFIDGTEQVREIYEVK